MSIPRSIRFMPLPPLPLSSRRAEPASHMVLRFSDADLRLYLRTAALCSADFRARCERSTDVGLWEFARSAQVRDLTEAGAALTHAFLFQPADIDRVLRACTFLPGEREQMAAAWGSGEETFWAHFFRTWRTLLRTGRVE